MSRVNLDAVMALADSTPTLILRTEASVTRDARALAAFKGGAEAVELLPALVAELRAARDVIPPLRDLIAVYSTLGWASWPQGLRAAADALAAYDKVTGEQP